MAFDIIELNEKFDDKIATKSIILKIGDFDLTIKMLHDNYIGLEMIQKN